MEIGGGVGTQAAGAERGGGIGERTSELTEKAKSEAIKGIDAKKGELTAMLDRVAASIEGESTIGSWVAGRMRRGREYLQRHSADELVSGVGSELRARPALVIGAAFVGGFAIARLLKD